MTRSLAPGALRAASPQGHRFQITIADTARDRGERLTAYASAFIKPKG